jgi:SAM-dependent methyltransferase
MKPGRILDIGSAAGFVLKGILETGWSGCGIEPNLWMAKYARKKLGLQVEVSALEEFRSSERFDVVSMIQVIAHLYDLRAGLQAAAKITRPGGYWLIETGDRESLVARMFGKHWYAYSPPSVLHWFSRQGLRRLVGQFGFVEVARGRATKWLNAAHAKSVMGYKLQGSHLGRLASGPFAIIPEHFAVPYPGDDLIWVLFQKTMTVPDSPN